MKWKLAAVAGVVLIAGVVAFLIVRPKEPPPAPARPHVVKPPMLRAPPREAFNVAPPAPPPPPVADAVAADASVQPPGPPPAVADPNAVTRPLTGPMNHHPPPPRSAGARFLALEGRYQRAQQAWTQLRSHKSPADQQKYDALLEQAGNELSSGSRQAGAQHLQEFVAGALDGAEP